MIYGGYRSAGKDYAFELDLKTGKLKEYEPDTNGEQKPKR